MWEKVRDKGSINVAAKSMKMGYKAAAALETVDAINRVADRGKVLSRSMVQRSLAALEETRSNGNPAVLLLDLKLPKAGGLEVLQQIKSDQKLRMIPVVVLTSSQEERDMVASYSLGVNAYVVKPVDFHEFVNAIRELGVFWAIIKQPPSGSIKTN